MITTVTLNPAIDKTILLEKFKYKAINKVQESREDLGGKGINVSKVIQSLGKEVVSIGFLGNGNRNKVAEFFEKEKLRYDFVYVDGNTRTNTKLVDLKNGVTTELNESGFIVDENSLDDFKEIMRAYARKSEFMVFSGSVPRGLDKWIYHSLINEVRDYTRVILDADGELLMEGLKSSPYAVKPNVYELQNAFGRKLKTNRDIVETARHIINSYGTRYVLVSLGEKGSLLVSGDKVFQADPIKVTVKSTVGAGDSMLGGFTYALSENADEKTALAYATACGTMAVTKEGTQSFSIDEINEMLGRTRIADVSSEYTAISAKK